MTPATWTWRVALLALLALHLAWSGGGAWGDPSPAALLLLALPLAAVAALTLTGRANARFWSGVVALLTFCHGVMEAWAQPAERIPAVLEVVLSLAIVLGASWDGIAARVSGRRRPPNV